MKASLRSLVGGVVLTLTAAAQAASITIVNPGFEHDFVPDGGFPVVPAVTLQGWSAYDPGSILNGNNNAIGLLNPTGTTYFIDPTPEGRNVALVFLSSTPKPRLAEAGIQQTLASTLAANTRYELSVKVGNIASGTGLGFYAQYGFFNLNGFPGYRVELLAGGIAIAEDDNSLAGSLGEGRWATSTVHLDVGAAHPRLGQALGIRLVNLNQAGTLAVPNIEVDFDDVRLMATPVPEAGTFALFAAGLGVVALTVRRRRQRA